MKFVFTDKKVTLPDAVHKYAEKRWASWTVSLRRTPPRPSHSVWRRSGTTRWRITIRSSGTIFRVSESTSDMHASIDAAVTTLERQIRKNKTRLEKRLRQGAFERALDAEVSSFAPDEPEEGEYRIVRSKTFPIKPMTRDEAICR